MPSRSVTLALWTLTSSTNPWVSTSKMALSSFNLLGSVVAALFAAYPGRLERLAVDYLRHWAEGPSSSAPLLACAGPSASSATSRPNARSGSSGRRSSCPREVVGQQSPSAAAANYVEDGVYDLAGGVHLGTTDGVGEGQVRFEVAPFGVGEIALICFSHARYPTERVSQNPFSDSFK